MTDSVHRLSADALQLLSLWGAYPGMELTPPAIASLVGRPRQQVRAPLHELVQAQLVITRAHDRYLVREPLPDSVQVLTEGVPEPERRAALRRLLDHYLYTAHRAEGLLLQRHYERLTLPPPASAVIVGEFADQRRALTWFTAELPVLLTAVTRAFEAGLDTHAWQLTTILATFLNRQGRWNEFLACQTVALRAAQRAGDRTGQARLHLETALSLTQLGRHDEAYTHLHTALDLFDTLGDGLGQARVHLHLGWLYDCQRRYPEALVHDQQALELFETHGVKIGQATALNAVGWDLIHLGRAEEGIDPCRRALDLFRELGDLSGEARAWDSVGYARYHLGHYSRAIACYEQALAIYQRLKDRYCEAETLIHLGDVRYADGRHQAAQHAWRRALAILEHLGHSDVEQVRSRLSR